VTESEKLFNREGLTLLSSCQKNKQMNVEQGMSKEARGNRHGKAQEDTGRCGRLIRQLVPFYIRHSLFDALRFEQQREAPFG
jgi:hypothetical protein